jgi:fumarate hydratase, class I
MNFPYMLIQLIQKTAVEIPDDIFLALKNAYEAETSSNAKIILLNIIKNCEKALNESKPICQDTGIPIFYVKHPRDLSEKELKEIINESILISTNEIPLRPNAVDSITGENLGNIPIIHFEESEKLEIELILKGGGSENVSNIYQLPNNDLNAFRNLAGVKKCILDAIFKAQGKGCPPYIIGVAIGGNIEDVAHLSKKQLLRPINDQNLKSELKVFEEDTLKEINDLGIGPLGLGGNTTALSVKITDSIRHPATFFVGISISCWCLRRGKL